jgi:hypothetical protein
MKTTWRCNRPHADDGFVTHADEGFVTVYALATWGMTVRLVLLRASGQPGFWAVLAYVVWRW